MVIKGKEEHRDKMPISNTSFILIEFYALIFNEEDVKEFDTNSGRQELLNQRGHYRPVLYVSYKPAPVPLKIYFEGRHH